jgi:3'(2'), 5'-bisphosphate nucleotidase
LPASTLKGEQRMARSRITAWNPADTAAFTAGNAAIARRNLIWLVVNAHPAFSVWYLWSVMVLFVPQSIHGFPTGDELLLDAVASQVTLTVFLASILVGGLLVAVSMTADGAEDRGIPVTGLTMAGCIVGCIIVVCIAVLIFRGTGKGAVNNAHRVGVRAAQPGAGTRRQRTPPLGPGQVRRVDRLRRRGGPELGRYLDEVTAIAVEAGKLTLKYRRDPRVAQKGDHGDDTSPVTDADLAADQYITEHLTALDSQIPIISGESKSADYATRKNSRRFWLVDPLDGTKEFVRGSDQFTVNIALIDNVEPVLGVIYVPARELLYYAEKGGGSWRRPGDGKPVHIFSSVPDLSKGLTVVESKSRPSPEWEDYLKDFPVKERLSAGSSLKFCLVAEGLADIYPRMNPTMEWDVAAGDCIYRNSARLGQRKSSLTYHKPTVKNRHCETADSSWGSGERGMGIPVDGPFVHWRQLSSG